MVEQPGGTGVDGVQSATSCSPRLYSSLLMAASHSFAWGEDFVLKCSVLEVVPVEVRCPLLHLRCTARVMFQSGMKMLAGKVLRVDDDP